MHATRWRNPIGCLKLQVIFRKKATNYRTLLRKMTYKDTFCGSSMFCSECAWALCVSICYTVMWVYTDITHKHFACKCMLIHVNIYLYEDIFASECARAHAYFSQIHVRTRILKTLRRRVSAPHVGMWAQIYQKRHVWCLKKEAALRRTSSFSWCLCSHIESLRRTSSNSVDLCCELLGNVSQGVLLLHRSCNRGTRRHLCQFSILRIQTLGEYHCMSVKHKYIRVVVSAWWAHMHIVWDASYCLRVQAPRTFAWVQMRVHAYRFQT